MNKKVLFMGLIPTLFFTLAPFSLVQAQNCGKFMGSKLVTYGKITCNEAKSVYKAFNHGKIPKGWTCGQSAGACGIDNRGFTFRFND